jgi:NAD(P)-dependent dehydrogenase (short-subunit alcohol dehydrogenase family)
MKTVLITGAGNGIGEVTAAVFAQKGYRVAVSDIDAAAAERSAAAIRDQGGDARAYAANIGIASEVEAMFKAIIDDFGRIDVAFNNAGVSGGRKALIEAEEADFDSCIQTNLKGTWLCMKQEIKQMLLQGSGVIVNNSSVIGMQAGVGAAYCASKHAVVGLTKSAALVYASQGVRINAVCPGLIESGLGKKLISRFGDDVKQLYATIPAGRPGQGDEVAKAVLWLASDDASFVHGHMLAVDGGYLAH